MWCPEGYSTLHEIVPILDELSDIYSDRLVTESFGPVPAVGSDEYLPEEFWPDFWQLRAMLNSPSEIGLLASEIELFHAWAVAQLLYVTNPFVSSPDGVIMRVSEVLYEHSLRLERFDWGERGHDIHLRRALLDVAFINPERRPLDGFRGFTLPSGIVSAPSTEAMADGDKDPLRTIQGHFSGWAICIKDREAPVDVQNLATLIGFDLSTKDRQNPDRLQHIYACLIEAYPSGKTDDWGTVQKRVGYSRRSINRALELHDPDKKWAAGGQSPSN